MWLKPVAERWPQHARGRARRAAFHDKVFAVEKVSRVSAVKRKWLESAERRENGRRPLPSVSQHALRTERTSAFRKRIHRDGIPTMQIKIAELRTGLVAAPRIGSFISFCSSVGGALPLLFRG